MKRPSKSVLRLYRAMGLEPFFDVLGWEYYRQQPPMTIQLYAAIPQDYFKTGRDLVAFCREWNIVTQFTTERHLPPDQPLPCNQSDMPGKYLLHVKTDKER